VQGNTIRWAGSADDVTRFWSIQRRDDSGDSWTQYSILASEATSLTAEPGSYVIRSVNQASQESTGVFVHVAADMGVQTLG